MKKIGSLLICFVWFAGMEVSAQITITQSDLESFLSIGHNLTTSLDTTTTSFNIGTPGSTSWDFSGISQNSQFTITTEAPAGTPFAGNFPAATVCLHGTTMVAGYSAESWSYVGVNGGLVNYGTGAQAEVSGYQSNIVMTNNPAAQDFVVPLTNGTSWTEDYEQTDSSIITGFPPIVNSSNIHVENMVDAYGTMILPGGGTVQALRIRSDMTQTGASYTRSISYMFITNSGTQFSVEAADTTSPNSGVIPIYGITFINSNVTAINQADNNIPQNFLLDQNYPNPFNPSTQINYSIPSAQKVTLKIYDELGKEVATLVNTEQAAGNYTVDFNASEFASGVYFYSIQAGNFMQMKKMILMK